MSGGNKLGYTYTPTPRWLLRHVGERQLTPMQYVLLAFLYSRADYDGLRKRGVTPRLTLDQIITGTAWSGKPESLRRQIARFRDDGYFGYEATGNSRTGMEYGFSLKPDPAESGAEPEAPPSPPVSAPQTRAETGHPAARSAGESARSAESALSPPVRRASRPAVEGTRGRSEHGAAEARAATESARDDESGSGSSPPVRTASPPVQEDARPHGERVSGSSAEVVSPRASDVPERANGSGRGTTDVEEGIALTPAGAHAREGDDGLLLALAEMDEPSQESQSADVLETIERARLAQVRVTEAEHAAARERTLRLADELPERERDVVRELVETFDAVLIHGEGAAA